MKIKAYPTLLLALMGSIDCVTTVIGIIYFGAVELNPIISGIASTNLPAFVALKLTMTALVCVFFVQAEKILLTTRDKSSKSFKWTRKGLKFSYAGATLFLLVVVINNAMVLARAI